MVSTSSIYTTGSSPVSCDRYVQTCNSMCRQGVFPLKGFPAVLGKEAAGTIVRLPLASDVLENKDYQKRGYKVGDIVAVVCPTVSLQRDRHLH